MEMQPCTSQRVTRDIFTLGLYEVWYRKTRYAIEDGHVEVNIGVLSWTETVIPADKINTVNTKMSPLMGCSSVVVDTGFGPSAITPHLTRKQSKTFAAAARQLRLMPTPQPHHVVRRPRIFLPSSWIRGRRSDGYTGSTSQMPWYCSLSRSCMGMIAADPVHRFARDVEGVAGVPVGPCGDVILEVVAVGGVHPESKSHRPPPCRSVFATWG